MIKSIRTQLSTEEIKTQLERDNPAITVKQVVRITSKTKDPTTVVIITSEEYNVSKAVNFNKQSPQPENYVPRVLRCSRCIKAFHSRADCRMKLEIFWYCSASHQFNQCQQQTQISWNQISTGSVLAALVSTGGNFRAANTYSSAETTWSRPDQLTLPNKKHWAEKSLQEQITQLKELVSESRTKTGEPGCNHQAINNEEAEKARTILEEVKYIQAWIQKEVFKMATMKLPKVIGSHRHYWQPWRSKTTARSPYSKE